MSTRRKYKTYKELSFTDDFLFCNIMQNNPDICKELVELLLDRKVGKVAYSETQKSIDLALEQKGFAWMSTLKTISALHTISKCRPPIPEICRSEVAITKVPLI